MWSDHAEWKFDPFSKQATEEHSSKLMRSGNDSRNFDGVFLKALLTRILGKEPRMVMYSDSSSSRQLIARKGLGKAHHLDVDLLWIQSIPRLIIKAIKGKDNPADLGTKSLSKDKIRKYMASLGYVGEIVDQEEVAGNGQVRRLNGNGRPGNGRKVSEEKLTKIIQVVTMAVLVALGEENTKRKVEDEKPKAKAKAKWGEAVVEEVEDDEESGKKQDEMIDLEKKDPEGFPKEALEEAKKRDEVKKAMEAKAKASKEGTGKKRGSKDAKKKSEKKEKKEKKEKGPKNDKKAKKEKKEKKSKKKDEAKEANINAEDL